MRVYYVQNSESPGFRMPSNLSLYLDPSELDGDYYPSGSYHIRIIDDTTVQLVALGPLDSNAPDIEHTFDVVTGQSSGTYVVTLRADPSRVHMDPVTAAAVWLTVGIVAGLIGGRLWRRRNLA